MPASNALLGYGSEFAIVSDASPDLYVPISEILSITPPSAVLDQIDVTHMTSPNRRREFISGLIDGGECSFEMNWIPGSTSDDRLFELLNLGVGISRRRSCRISYPNGVTDTFDAELTGYEPAVPFDDKMTATITFKVTGDVTRGTT
jgi:Lambda phage tail tube protein, TTP